MAEQLVYFGSDIDDSIVHSGEHTLDAINAEFGTALTLLNWYEEPFDKVAWGMEQKVSWGLVNEILHSQVFIDAVQIVKGAREFARFMTEQEQRLGTSTGRPETPSNIAFTHALLEQRFDGLFPSNTFFSDHFGQVNGIPGSKVPIAINEGFTHIADDHKKHVNGLAEIPVKPYLLDRPWNQGEVHPRVIRVPDFDAIAEDVARDIEILGSLEPVDRVRYLQGLISL